jgi:hypothetical protein
VEHPVDFQVVVCLEDVLLGFLHEGREHGLQACCSREVLLGDGGVGVVP